MKTKKAFNLILFVFLLSTIVGCKRNSEKNNTHITDEKTYQIENIVLNEIPDSTYTIDLKKDNLITFKKSLKNSSTLISIQINNEQKFIDDDKFILYAESYIENQMKAYEMKSLHLNAVGFKNTTCLKFDGTFRDSTNQGTNKEYISHDGYLCLVPDNESKIAEIKVVHFSTERLMPKDVIYEYKSMIEQLKFTNNND